MCVIPHMFTHVNNISTSIFSKTENKQFSKCKINNQICITLILHAKRTDSILQLRQNKFSSCQLECQKIPEATSLKSTPSLSKGDKPEDNSIIIHTGELVDTLFNEQNKSLLETIAYNINKSMEALKGETDNEQGNFLNSPALEKALDSTQSDPQIKNVLDEFLDDVHGKSKNNILKQESYDNEEDKNYDNNIILMMNEEGNMRPTYYEHFEMVSNNLILQTNSSNVEQACNLNAVKIEPDIFCKSEDEYLGKSNNVKIASRLTTMVKSHTSILEKHIFPKRRKQLLQECGIRSKFRKSNITPIQTPESVQSTQSITIEVPNQNSFETQAKNNIEINNIIRLPDVSKVSKVSSEVKDVHDTPYDILIPLKLSQVNETKTRDIDYQRNIISHNKCTTDGNYKYNRKEKNNILNKSNLSLDSIQSTTINTKTDQNCIFNMDNTILNKSNKSKHIIINNNTSCVTVHNDKSKIQELKVVVSLNIMDYLKKPKVFDDSDCKMVYLNLSEKFTFLDIPSELYDVQLSNPIPSSLLSTIKTFDITPEIEPGKLTNAEDIIIPATSTPKDVVVEKKLDERQNRVRRSPSFWEGSVHNYSINKCKESNHWRNTNYRVYYDKKYRLQIDSQKLNRVDNTVKEAIKRTSDRTDYKTPTKVTKVEHQQLLKNVDIDDFLSILHGRK